MGTGVETRYWWGSYYQDANCKRLSIGPLHISAWLMQPSDVRLSIWMFKAWSLFESSQCESVGRSR